MDAALDWLGAAASQALAFIIPVSCVGCGEPDAAVCPGCAGRMAGPVTRRDLDPGLPVWAGTAYTDVARRTILALKNEQRTDVAGPLAEVLCLAIGSALDALPGGATGEVALASLPSTRAAFRRRGYRPVDVVVARTAFKLEHPLTWRRQPGDQIGLGIDARTANLAGSLRAGAWARGRRFLLIDDVVTTGGTLREARRALVEAGGAVVGAAVIAATGRRGVTTPRPTQVAE